VATIGRDKDVRFKYKTIKVMAERVGFSKAVCYSSRAFNKMPETVVLTAS
jgi:hypothetical protein